MMYSNYFVKPKRNANILRFTPPGFKYSIDVPFPGRVLPVCARCKKNFKTREHCRTKECHYGLPWTDTYLCITLDPTCTSPDGKLLDGPFVAQGVPNTAYQFADNIDPKTPSCAPCKEKNYTRTYCRTTKKHRTLPWSTVYLVLTLRPDGAIPPADEIVNPELVKEMNAKRRKTSRGSKPALPPLENKGVERENGEAKDDSGKPSDGDDGKKDERNESSQHEIEAAKLKEIKPSRTFLATISVECSRIQWLEFDASQQATQNRMREEMNQKMQEEGGSFQPHYMMHPPMGMNPMIMSPPFHSHPATKQDNQSSGGSGSNANGSNNSVSGNSNSGGGSSNGGGPPQDSNNGNHNSQQQQQHYNTNPHYPPFPSQQEMMYQGFDPRMAYGFPPPWGRGHPMAPGVPMDPGMMHFDGQNPMMPQMGGWGPSGNFYNPPPPHFGNTSHPGPNMSGGGSGGGSGSVGGAGGNGSNESIGTGGGGEMPQSYESGSKAASQATNSSNNGKDEDGDDSKSTEESNKKEAIV